VKKKIIRAGGKGDAFGSFFRFFQLESAVIDSPVAVLHGRGDDDGFRAGGFDRAPLGKAVRADVHRFAH